MAVSLSEELEIALDEASDAIDIILDNDAEEQTEITEEAEYDIEDVLSYTEDAEDDLAAEIADEVVNKALINDDDILDIERGGSKDADEGIDADAAEADPDVKVVAKELIENGILSHDQVRSLLEGEDEYDVVKKECGDECEDDDECEYSSRFVASNRFSPAGVDLDDDREVYYDDCDDDDDDIVDIDDDHDFEDDDDEVVIELEKDEVHDNMFGNDYESDYEDENLDEAFEAVEAYDEAAKRKRAKKAAKKNKLSDDDFEDDDDEGLDEAFEAVEAYDEAAKRKRAKKAKKNKLSDDDFEDDDDDDEGLDESSLISDKDLGAKFSDDYDYEEDDGADFDDDVYEANDIFGQKYNFGSYSNKKTTSTFDKVGLDFGDNVDPNAKAMIR